MKIHEYQAKKLLQDRGVSVPAGSAAGSAAEARQVASALGGEGWVVKAQIHAGGRGKGGGVKRAASLDEVERFAGQVLGSRLVTPQTGPQGQQVRQVLVEESCDIAQELYCSLFVNRAAGRVAVMLSPAGGMDIEAVAAEQPEKIFRADIDVLMGLADFQARSLVSRLPVSLQAQRALAPLLKKFYSVFRDMDCSLIEINPLVLTPEDQPVVLDAKMQFDDNALFRRPGVAALRDTAEEDPLEVEAASYDLSYIKLSGNVGCIVNGAGLAMATMDAITLAGASPANFLDVGGAADADRVENAFRILVADPDVKAVLINVFGGILRCDVFAEGVLHAVEKAAVEVPVVVRIEGTNAEEGQRLLAESGLNLLVANDMADAAEKVANVVNAKSQEAVS
ncbi:MAG: ADP-forming succinate--CoA ligase subunit beta [Candidatus Tectomicrobia bacterium]|nr:ADP-forming succinate--CoA ligase subunit beta [Candidatus Tectomicrobia bacterium]